MAESGKSANWGELFSTLLLNLSTRELRELKQKLKHEEDQSDTNTRNKLDRVDIVDILHPAGRDKKDGTG